jgi:hypothetical protein
MPHRRRINPSQRLSITLFCVATRNASDDTQFIGAASPQTSIIVVAETCLLRDRQTVTERVLHGTVRT